MKWLHLPLLAASLLAPASAQRVGAPTDDLTKVGVDELFSVQVTSVGRKAQQISKAPASVFVLTAEDIRRSGATSIPEALRWVPGMTVLSLDGRTWAVSIRGSARVYSDKILVMIDGRSLYTPMFSGVIWDAIDVPLSDVERIELVRGPGAVMWGPNAVNGVINVITKKAQQTKGSQITASAGNESRGVESRWGAAPNDRIAYRVWGKLDYRTPAYDSPGMFHFATSSYLDPSIRNLDAATGRMGFRVDGQPDEKDQWTIQGDLYKADRQDPAASQGVQPAVDRMQAHTEYNGGYLQARWARTSTSGSESALQFSYDRNHINYSTVGGDLQNLTVDFQRRMQTGERNEIYWGAGFQQYWDHSYSRRFTSFDPSGQAIRSVDIVLRDEWQLVPGRFLVSAGVRIDYNSYRDVEYQPSVRLLYTPKPNHSAWLAASRAVRTPNRADRDIVADFGATMLPGLGIPVSVTYRGSKSMRSEVARTAEGGYRYQSGQRWSVDTSAFLSAYGRLRSVDYALAPTLVFSDSGVFLRLPMHAANSGAGRSYGGETWATVQVLRGWRLIPSYSYVKDDRWLPASTASHSYMWERAPSDLRHQGTVRSQHDLARNWQLDLMARARSRDRAYDLPGVLLVDARLNWRPARVTEISFALHNLTDRRVFET
ncbi:MAG: TonB-dependent receptor, partial [Candidatus Solibacter sp.]|nr:TonB-dependent receptor [Candidatus Solibacter sp.]